MKMQTSTIYLTTDYGKKVEVKITRNQYEDYSVRYLIINGTYYSARHIRTAYRESIIVDYVNKHVDLNQHFYQVRLEAIEYIK